MGKSRVLGRHVKLLVNSSQLLLPIALGTIDEFNAVSNTDIRKRRPMGFSIEAATERYGGYDLTLKIAKTDPMLERWNHLVERGIFAGNNMPEIFILENTKHYKSVLGNNIIESWLYRNVTLFGLDKNTSDEITQTIKGFATHKEIGPVDFTFADLNWLPQIGYQEAVHRTAQTNIDIGSAISNALSNAIDDINPFN